MKKQDPSIAADPTNETLPSEVDLTRIYLREVGAVPLLDREKEVELAGALTLARRDFAAATAKLPAELRKIVVSGAIKPKSKQLWSMEQIENCHERLRRYTKQDPELRDHKAYISIMDAKRRLDRNRDAMVEANLRLVAHVAKKFRNQGLPYMDLVQEGNIGLMKAVEKFEHERGYKFSTYAFWWIKQAITRAIADKSRTIRIPVHLLEKVNKVQRAIKELEHDLGREPTVKEISAKTELPVKAIQEILGGGDEL